MTNEDKLKKIIQQEEEARKRLETLRAERVAVVTEMHESDGLSLRKIGKIANVSHVRVMQWIESN